MKGIPATNHCRYFTMITSFMGYDEQLGPWICSVLILDDDFHLAVIYKDSKHIFSKDTVTKKEIKCDKRGKKEEGS